MPQNQPIPNCFSVDVDKTYEYVVSKGSRYSVLIDGKAVEIGDGPIKIYTVEE